MKIRNYLKSLLSPFFFMYNHYQAYKDVWRLQRRLQKEAEILGDLIEKKNL